MTLVLNESDIISLFPMEDAIKASDLAFKLQAGTQSVNHPRIRIANKNQFFNYMTASSPELGFYCMKTYSIHKNTSPTFYVYLYDYSNGDLVSIMNASSLGQIRTGAASGIATKYLSKQNSTNLSIIGTGYQAKTQAQAIVAIRPITLIKVYSRSLDNRNRFAKWLEQNLNIECIPVTSPEDCIEKSDIITTITTSKNPVFRGSQITPGTHINAAGGNHYMRRELDDDTILNSDLITTDDISQARVECGDLINPIDRGLLRWNHIHQLSEIVSGLKIGRRNNNQITLYESQGLAIQDLTAAAHIYSKAIQSKIGTNVDIETYN